MNNIFTKHPNSVGESYFRHFIKSFGFGVKLILIALRAFVHAVLPFLFEHSASDQISTLNDVLQKRKNSDNHSDNH